MSLTLNFESYQAWAPVNLIAVTFTSSDPTSPTNVSVTDAGFYRTGAGISEREESQGNYQRFDATFSIRASLLAGVGGAKPGDSITDAEPKIWTVLRASPPVISGIWQLTCINLAIDGAFAVSGVLSRPTSAKNAAYRPSLTSYTTIATVSCWVQTEDATAGDQFGRRTMSKKFTGWLASPVSAQAKDKFTANGQDFSILRASKPNRLDQLQELDLEAIS